MFNHILSIINRETIIFEGGIYATRMDARIFSIEDQKKAWSKAAKKMKWGIGKPEFESVPATPTLSAEDVTRGFAGYSLFYGFGDDGSGNADPVLSGKVAWEHAGKIRKKAIWQSPYITFNNPEAFRLRPDAPPRPKGFYIAKVHTGELYRSMTASYARKLFRSMTGFGPEGFQFLCITHQHYISLMSERKAPFMVLADYDVAPYGFNDFFDVPQIFCSNNILGLGIGNIEQNYSGFAIPVLQLQV